MLIKHTIHRLAASMYMYRYFVDDDHADKL